jgi:hypothetical protein
MALGAPAPPLSNHAAARRRATAGDILPRRAAHKDAAGERLRRDREVEGWKGSETLGYGRCRRKGNGGRSMLYATVFNEDFTFHFFWKEAFILEKFKNLMNLL